MSSTDGRRERFLVLSAVHNNATTIEELHERLAATTRDAGLDARFLYVDDGSTDASWSLIAGLARADSRVAGLRLRGNFGQTRALCAGLEASDADVVVYIDADLEIPPESVGLLAAAIAAGHDFVGGDRSADPSRKLLRRLGARVFNVLTRALTGLEVRDVGCGLVAMRPNVVDAVVAELRRRPIQIIKPAMISAASAPIEVRISSNRRDSNYSLLELLRFAAEFIALSATRPLAVVAAAGTAVAASNLHRAARVVAGTAAAGAAATLLASLRDRGSGGGIYVVDERVGWVAAPAAPPRA